MYKCLIVLIILSSRILSYELTTIPEMTFPLGMNDNASIVAGTNLSGQAVVWTTSNGVTIAGDGEFWGVSENGKISGSLINIMGKEEAVLCYNGDTGGWNSE